MKCLQKLELRGYVAPVHLPLQLADEKKTTASSGIEEKIPLKAQRELCLSEDCRIWLLFSKNISTSDTAGDLHTTCFTTESS